MSFQPFAGISFGSSAARPRPASVAAVSCTAAPPATSCLLGPKKARLIPIKAAVTMKPPETEPVLFAPAFLGKEPRRCRPLLKPGAATPRCLSGTRCAFRRNCRTLLRARCRENAETALEFSYDEAMGAGAPPCSVAVLLWPCCHWHERPTWGHSA